MRPVTRAYVSTLILTLAIFPPLMFPLPAHASETGYRLLELDGYKVKWGDRQLGAAATVSYAFAEETLRFDSAHNCRDLVPVAALLGERLSMETLARETEAAFRAWERVAGLSFQQVSDIREADIILGAQGKPQGRAFASVSYAPEAEKGVRAINQSLVCLNPEREWKVGFDGDEDIYDIRYTLIHEIGHAIGLDHPGRSGQMMAFRYTEAFNELQPGDVRGVQLLYGNAAGEGGPAHHIETQLAQRSVDTYPVEMPSVPSVMSSAEDEGTESNEGGENLLLSRDGRVALEH